MAARKERAAPAKRTPKAVSNPQPSPEEVRKLISEAAYYRAKQRGFTPGHELEDWIQAEAEVLRRLNGPRSAA
jgi:hypothetical protein